MNAPKPLLAVVTLAALWSTSRAPQDPPAPQEPPQAQEPATAPKTPPGAPTERHPLEGVYELRRRIIAGVVDPKPSRGWLAITRRHLFVCFAAPGPDRDLPLLRAGVRTWTEDEGSLQMSVRLGWYTDAEGTVRLEQPDTRETRRIERMQGGVRLWQDQRDYLDFERVE